MRVSEKNVDKLAAMGRHGLLDRIEQVDFLRPKKSSPVGADEEACVVRDAPHRIAPHEMAFVARVVFGRSKAHGLHLGRRGNARGKHVLLEAKVRFEERSLRH